MALDFGDPRAASQWRILQDVWAPGAVVQR